VARFTAGIEPAPNREAAAKLTAEAAAAGAELVVFPEAAARDPMGVTLAALGEEPGVAVAELSAERVAAVRANAPLPTAPPAYGAAFPRPGGVA